MCSANKSGRLHHLELTVVGEVAELHIPRPIAAGKPELLAPVDEWRDALAHPCRVTRIDECEMALLQGVIGGDVTHDDVEQSVPVEVAERDPHSFERVVSQHLRRRSEEIPAAV